MKVQRYHFRGLAALSFALPLFSSSVTATSSIDSSPTTGGDSSSTGCVTDYIGNGDCDLFNNNEDCGGYDGGDCCACTCVSTEYFICGAAHHGGFTCLDPTAACVDDDDATTLPDQEDLYLTEYSTTSLGCVPGYISDGFCDTDNNNEECGFDGGDCCECTCVDTVDYTCGVNGKFACLDPSAPCADDDDYDPEDNDPTFSTSDDDDQSDSSSSSSTSSSSSSSSSLCLDEVGGDGNCDSDNNIEECGYDGGDCCECDCVSTPDFACGDNDYDCIDPSSSCTNGYVLASTKTTVGVSANAYDTRPGQDSNMVGCLDDGCAPELSRDGISDDIESRWSCAQKIVPGGGLCEIVFSFNDPQDIMEVQVAFWKGDQRSRTLEATINGEVIGEFDSYTGSTFNALRIQGVGVETISFTTVGLTEDDWISLLEVRFLVDP